jgi:hypothetical protein
MRVGIPGACALVVAGLVGTALTAPRPLAAQQAAPAPSLAQRARAVLEKNCATSGCHGNERPYKFNVLKRETLVAEKVVVPKSAATSELVKRLVTGSMPLGGYQGKAGQKLPAAEIQLLRAWIDAGAPDGSPTAVITAPAKAAALPEPEKPPVKRTFVSEAQVLRTIIQDLSRADERIRPYLRYYSLANLSDNAEVPDSLLELYRTSLSKLVNHLSWEATIVRPKAVDAEKLILRVDLRDFGWDAYIWKQIIAAYPYGVKPRHLTGEIAQIYALSGAELPYVRVDWFVANASISPLYETILKLPKNVAELERDKLFVDVNRNLANERALRSGLRNSNVSRNNRAMERHPARYGAYWKSFDFAGNKDVQNIFRDPLDFREDGGEYIFHLPNGLQGYFISNAKGEFLADAPVNIVRDLSNREDPVVHNGRSCIGCHVKGMQTFHDEMRPQLGFVLKAHFDQDKAEALYRGQEELERVFEEDNRRFQEALKQTGSPLPNSPAEEPVSLLGVRHESTMSVAQAAADVYYEDVKAFQNLVSRSTELGKVGFFQLLGENGGIKRDTWEQYFGLMVEELRLGEYLKPTLHHSPVGVPDDLPTVSVGQLSGPAGPAEEARQALIYWLNQSKDLRLVEGKADYHFKGTLRVKEPGSEQVALQVGDETRGKTEDASGSAGDAGFLAQQVANKLNFAISHNWLPVQVIPTSGGGAFPAPHPVSSPALDTIRGLAEGFGTQGPVKISLALDRGPGATYRSGEDVGVYFKVDRAAYVQIFGVDCTGQVVRLFPNRQQADGRVLPNRPYQLVGSDGKSIIDVDPNGTFGEESVLAIAAAAEDEQPRLELAEGGLVKKGLAGLLVAKSLRVKDGPDGAPAPPPAGKGLSSAVIKFHTVK